MGKQTNIHCAKIWHAEWIEPKPKTTEVRFKSNVKIGNFFDGIQYTNRRPTNTHDSFVNWYMYKEIYKKCESNLINKI